MKKNNVEFTNIFMCIVMSILALTSLAYLLPAFKDCFNAFDYKSYANNITYTGYFDRIDESYNWIYYYYDKDTNVVYFGSDTEVTAPLYNADGTLVTYDKWLSNRNKENNIEN